MFSPNTDESFRASIFFSIIAMSTPPFAIVHVNKAFCEASGLVHADVIGKPVEDVLQVEQDIPSSGANVDSSLPLRSRFLISDRKRCQIHVAPITDRSQNTRGMTHVLVELEDMEDGCSPAESEALVDRINSATGPKAEKLSASSDASSIRSHKVTIG